MRAEKMRVCGTYKRKSVVICTRFEQLMGMWVDICYRPLSNLMIVYHLSHV